MSWDIVSNWVEHKSSCKQQASYESLSQFILNTSQKPWVFLVFNVRRMDYN